MAQTRSPQNDEEAANKRQPGAQLCLAIIKTKCLSCFPQALGLTLNGKNKKID
ncbi:hypothetical protein BDFB_012301 [Asbolus verrucosus]|uniref:Uncharacterized protein n=1 Tax=Asbolus verrucosus TaxID=1661398 RepID=A0A482W3T4_ASBVE|nr:hypothetical protein BDFB_012301 [Asbolus verrucosus]